MVGGERLLTKSVLSEKILTFEFLSLIVRFSIASENAKNAAI
jgi:hypothetical protein